MVMICIIAIFLNDNNILLHVYGGAGGLERTSLALNSLLTGEIQGNFAIFSEKLLGSVAIADNYSGLLAISLRMITGNKLCISGNIFH